MESKSKEEILSDAYRAFNARDIEGVLVYLDPEVDWPNGMEGGIEHGHEAVRNYWTRQWKTVDPHVEPLSKIKVSDNLYNVSVHQVVRNMDGAVLVDQIVHHFYSFRDNLVTQMEIKPG